jgi:Ca2+-binding RTX toxin-like protein
MSILGTNGNDTRTGTAGNDSFDLSQGGADTVSGSGGNDTIFMGAALTAQDRINGGAGDDVVTLSGDYAALTFAHTTMTAVEKLVLTNGAYNITMHDTTVSTGKQLIVDAQSADSLTFDGSAETNGAFLVYSSYANDSVIGGAGGDYFVMGMGGADTVRGGAGGDVISMGTTFGANDVVDGGAGADTVYISGTYGATIVLNGTNMIGIESVIVTGGHDYTFQVKDSLLAAGQVFNLDARSLGAEDRAIFFGGEETDGSYDLYDGTGHDMLYGSQQGDLFRASNGGHDLLSGNGGDDVFAMDDKLTAEDIIYGGAGYDTVDLNGDYAAGVTFSDGLAGIERFTLRGDFTYKLVFADANLNTGEGMLIGGGGKVFIDVSDETDAAYDLYGTTAADTLIGGGGSDAFRLYDAGSDVVSGGAGGDSFLLSYGASTVGNATLDGGADGDIFYLDGAAVQFDATLGTLKLGATYTASVTSIESAYGSQFSDVLTGGAGYNFLAGQAGNDTLTGGADADALVGGAGSDRASYAGSSAGVTVSLATGKGTGGDAEGDTLAEIEGLIGSSHADVLTGNHVSNRLQGGDGADTLRGSGGADTLTGGNGADRFNFSSTNDSTAAKQDIVTDFNAAQNDRLGLSVIDANTTMDGNNAFDFIGSAAFSAAGQLRFADGVLSGDVNGDGTADLVIRLTGVTSLAESCLIL